VLEIFNPNTPSVDNTVLIAGGLGGAFRMTHPAKATNRSQWSQLATKLPHGLVNDLHYNYTDNVLVAGILGRGAWTLTGFFGGGTVTAAAAVEMSEASEAPGSGFRLAVPLPPPVAPEALLEP
jgi:hypothetical protein